MIVRPESSEIFKHSKHKIKFGSLSILLFLRLQPQYGEAMGVATKTWSYLGLNISWVMDVSHHTKVAKQESNAC